MVRKNDFADAFASGASTGPDPKPGFYKPVFRSFAAFDSPMISATTARDKIVDAVSDVSATDSNVALAAGLFNFAVVSTSFGSPTSAVEDLLPVPERFSSYI